MARQLITSPLRLDGLGFIVEPASEETLDGWLRYLADHMGTTVSGVARHLGVEMRANAYHLIRDLTETDLETISTGTGVSKDVLRRMTLQRWEHLQLRPSGRMRGTAPGAWKRGSGSRFCPSCLVESDGRWKLAWHLHWTFVCTRHRRLLADRCPRCGAVPKSRARWSTSGRYLSPLGCDPPCDLQELDRLVEKSGEDLGDEHPFMETQREVDAVLDGSVEVAVTAGALVPGLIWFRDLSVLTRSVATARPAALRAQGTLTGDEWLNDESRALLEDGRDTATRLAQVAANSGIMAAATTKALALLASRDTAELEVAVSWIKPNRRKKILQVAEGYPLSLALTRALAEGAQTRATARMARLASVNAEVRALRQPSSSRPSPVLTTDHVPARLPTRLGEIYPQLLRADLPLTASAAAMMVPAAGSPGTHLISKAAALLGVQHNQAAIIATWCALQDGADGDAIVRDIMTLRSTYEHSRENGDAPNYGRRRHTFPEPRLLSTKRTGRLADELGHRHTGAFRVAVSLYVWELLTHSDSLLSPPGLDQHGALRMRFRRQRQVWDRKPPEPIVDLATKLLRRERIGEMLRPIVVRTGDGTWLLCDPNEATRDAPDPAGMRRFTTHWTPGQLALAGPEQLVHFAVFSNNPVARRLDSHLVTACHEAMASSASASEARRRPATHTARNVVEELIGRSLDQPTWCDAMGGGRRPLARVLLWHYDRWAPLRRTLPAR